MLSGKLKEKLMLAKSKILQPALQAAWHKMQLYVQCMSAT